MRRCEIDWYYLYLNHPGGSRLEDKTWEVCYCKGLVTQAYMDAKPCKICQWLKKRKKCYRLLLPKNIVEQKLWNIVHIHLIGPYAKSIIQQKTGVYILHKWVRLICTTMIDTTKGCFKIIGVLCFDLTYFIACNDAYIDKSYARVN